MQLCVFTHTHTHTLTHTHIHTHTLTHRYTFTHTHLHTFLIHSMELTLRRALPVFVRSLNLVLVDEEDRRYFKQQEIQLW